VLLGHTLPTQLKNREKDDYCCGGKPILQISPVGVW
jgi:hypothetical protein